MHLINNYSTKSWKIKFRLGTCKIPRRAESLNFHSEIGKCGLFCGVQFVSAIDVNFVIGRYQRTPSALLLFTWLWNGLLWWQHSVQAFCTWALSDDVVDYSCCVKRHACCLLKIASVKVFGMLVCYRRPEPHDSMWWDNVENRQAIQVSYILSVLARHILISNVSWVNCIVCFFWNCLSASVYYCHKVFCW